MEDLGKYVSIVYLVAGALLSWLFYRAVHEVMLWVEVSDASLAGGVTPSMLVGILLGGGVTAYLWNRADARTFLGEVVEELSRVTWPTGEETRSSTIVVVVVAVLASFLVAIADYVWNGFTTLMLSI
jgi:preprotein translocase subunit SecE